MHYDPTYEATVATVIPLIFVAIVVDLGLAKRSNTPLSACIVLSTVVVLLASELLCLNALSNQRDLRAGEADLVAGAVIFSGAVVLFRVGEPLVKVVVRHWLGKVIVSVFGAGFLLLVVLHSQRIVTGGTAIVIFAFCALVFGVIVPGFVAMLNVVFNVASGASAHVQGEEGTGPAKDSSQPAASPPDES